MSPGEAHDHRSDGYAERRGIESNAPRPTAYVHAGQVVVPAEPAVLSTVLGSCVAVCLWDPVKALGGMNHYMLPHDLGLDAGSARFGPVANELLYARLLERGAAPVRLVARVFGGAFVSPSPSEPRQHLGRENRELAFAWLERRRIPVASSDVGGLRGRKLLFRTSDGSAWIRSL